MTEFVAFLQALLILAAAAVVLVGPPTVVAVKYRRRLTARRRAWDNAVKVAVWEPTTDTASDVMAGPYVRVGIRRVARLGDTDRERVLDTLHIRDVSMRADGFDTSLQAALADAHRTCDALNSAHFPA